MPQGFQVMDENGAVTWDVGNSVLVLQGTLQTTQNQSGSITMDSSLGTLWYIVGAAPAFSGYDRPSFTLSGNTLSWTANTASSWVFYGTR